ncbi:MAG TPA: nuclease-related domain-containing protein [Candidatus Acidoferrum sp.]|jgi:hypothetical protein|nr:nuclease-related domain-containing protein [Candidatus Acidoferrum sp.]
MNQNSRILIAGGLTLLALTATVAVFRLRLHVTNTRALFDARLLRSPGESLRKRLEQLNEKLMYCIALFVVGPILFAWATPGFPDQLSTGLLAAVVGLGLVPVMLVAMKYRNYSLGLAGERAVGEELNQLMLEGCRVFHDYLGGSKWNIDHIVIAPSSVYAIETKTRSKRRAPRGKLDQEVIYDGAKLLFPRYSSAREPEQARRNAADLSRELTSATGEPVKVKPILTFPGWYINRRGKSDVTVVNPKEIRRVIISNDPPRLSPQQIQRIAHQIEQKCRDVGF